MKEREQHVPLPSLTASVPNPSSLPALWRDAAFVPTGYTVFGRFEST